MAAVATQTVQITINDVEIAVPKGELIVEAVKRLGLEIPIFCYHPRMKPVGMCRMCLVEVGFKQPDGSVRKMPKPQAGCTLPASKGMVVYTDTEMVHRDRKGVLEFLLINHPLDCPICDRGGECPLQNNTLFYGPSTSRFIEVKRHNHKAFPLSKFVTLDLERCIQCGRCVRFTEEISGDSELAFRFRGAEMQPATYELTDFTSKFSGNVIEICPVGALTNREYRFRARPWDLETKPAICTVCSNGCNLWFDHRVGKMVRINGRTNEAVNEEWTCDRGKFGHEFYNDPRRLTKPLLRAGDRLIETDWPKAYAAILTAFSKGGNYIGLLGGASVSLEGQFMMARLFREVFSSNNVDYRYTKHLRTASERPALRLQGPEVQLSIAEIESKTAILVFGTSLADEQPIVYLRVRKAWFHHEAKVVVAYDTDTDGDTFAHLILRYRPGTAADLAQGLLAARGGAATISVDEAANRTGIPAERIIEAAQLLGETAIILSTHGLYNQPHGVGTLEALIDLAHQSKATFNLFALDANAQGAEEIGFLPYVGGGELGLGTHRTLEMAATGQLQALWLLDTDPFTAHPDRALVERAIENVDFLVVQASVETEMFGYASVVLPMTAPAEQDGTYVNVERRVQRMKPVLAAKGEAKPAWKIASECMFRAEPQRPYFNSEEVFAEIALQHPGFPASYADLPAEGFRLV